MHEHDSTDAELVAQTLAGNRDAFGCLYDRYARLVSAVLYRAAFDRPGMHDLAQETFLRAYRNLQTLREPDRFGRWIVGIARQVARERRRSLHRDRHEFVGQRSFEIAASNDETPRIDDAEESGWVFQKMMQLDEREQLAIHAFFLEGRDVRQAADLLQLSRSGTYALIARAVARLAALVRTDQPETGIKK